MNNVPVGSPPNVRQQRSLCEVHYNLRPRSGDMARPLVLPSGLDVQAFHLQVAGHQNNDNTKYSGKSFIQI
jgi:hypothetical protein